LLQLLSERVLPEIFSRPDRDLPVEVLGFVWSRDLDAPEIDLVAWQALPIFAQFLIWRAACRTSSLMKASLLR